MRSNVLTFNKRLLTINHYMEDNLEITLKPRVYKLKDFQPTPI